jgi:ABC-type molybdate transport system permease subunit
VGKPFTVIGVMAPGYAGITPEYSIDIWLQESDGRTGMTNDHSAQGWYRPLARLKPGVSEKQAIAELDTIFQRYLQEHAGSLDESERSKLSGRHVLLTGAAAGDSGLGRQLYRPLVVLMARVIPAVSLLVPWYYVFSNLHMVGGFTVLILSHMFVSLPLIVYIMMGYFDGLPLELEESGLVDGLTPIGAFRRITLPLSTPGIATAGILSFIFSWNNFMFALVLSSADTKTLPVAIFDFVGYASIDWGGLMAASTVVTLPIMLVALFAQKYVVSGLTAGATKG